MRKNLTREERALRRGRRLLIAAIVLWALLVVDVVVRWAIQ